jgi:hypothetical protein
MILIKKEFLKKKIPAKKLFHASHENASNNFSSQFLEGTSYKTLKLSYLNEWQQFSYNLQIGDINNE